MIIEKSTEQTIQLYYDVYVPEAVPDKPMPLLVALHGYEGRKESMLALARQINSRDFVIASLQAPNAFLVREGEDPAKTKIGFGWMMQYQAAETIRLHHQTVRSVIDDIAEEHSIDRTAIFMIGFSQSVSLNYRFAFAHPDLIRGVVAVCGGIPGDWDSDRYHKSETDVLIIAGETDPFYPLERSRAFEEALKRRARSVEMASFPVGHVFPRESLPVIDRWLRDRLSPAGGLKSLPEK